MKKSALVAVTFVLLSVPAAAHAEGDHDHGLGISASASASASPPGAEPRQGEEKKEEAEPKWEVLGEFVGGATTLDVLNQGRPTRIELPPANDFDSTRISTYTFLVGIERRLGERFTVGARIPLVDGELRSRNGSGDPRSVLIGGNLELEGGYIALKRRQFDLQVGLGVALPTAGGSEPPTADDVAKDPTKSYDYTASDRFATARAASLTRGAYDSALFEPGRLGLVPGVSANFHLRKLTITPLVKYESLIDVTGDAVHGYVGELVAGVKGSYRVVDWFDPGVHVFMSATVTGTDESDTTFGVLEPFVRFPLHGLTPQASFFLPFAGNLVTEKTWGLRLALAGEF